MEPPRVILISETSVVPEAALIARIRAVAGLPEALRRRVAVMLRDPALSGRALHRLGASLREATGAIGASLVVNDRLDLALALGADGVHLGRLSVEVEDARALLGQAVWVSRSCHTVDEVVQAAAEGADAALLSPIFPSPGKGPPLGPGALTAAREALDRRGYQAAALVALGGIDPSGAAACFAAGAGAVAAIRGDVIGVLGAH
jgi:thiamine-phosphate pyrophosphorylase